MKTKISAMGLAYTVNKDGSTCRIVGIGSFDGKELTVPETLDGYKVKSIANEAFRECAALVSAEIGDGVESIGAEAFACCTALCRVKIADSVKNIGWGAFLDCVSLSDLSLGNGVTEIGACAFFGCGAQIRIPASAAVIGEQAFCGAVCIAVSEENARYVSADGNLYTKDMKTLLQYATGKKETSFTIPDSVTEIGCFAFGGAVHLSAVRFGKNVRSIGSNAFHACTALWAAVLPDGLQQIGESAFCGCTSLSAVSVGKTAPKIGWGAFANCPNLCAVKHRGKHPIWKKILLGKKQRADASFRELSLGGLKFKFRF